LTWPKPRYFFAIQILLEKKTLVPAMIKAGGEDMITGGPFYRLFGSQRVPPALLALLLLALAAPDTAGMQRGLTAAIVRRHYHNWLTLETPRFHLRFTAADREEAEWVATEAERVAFLVEEHLLYRPSDAKPWLVIAPDQAAIRQAFGWGDGTAASGVYLVDTIIILSPQAFSEGYKARRRQLYACQGPLVHEITHYVVDARAGGNYPRWFSEGLAQLMEYRLLNYEWLEEGSSLGSGVFSPDQLEQSFDTLDNQALAYRQALSLVTYLESLQGMGGINRLLDLLARGNTFYHAVQAVYGLDRNALHDSWENWFPAQNRWFLRMQD
jgi:hypothetical protein